MKKILTGLVVSLMMIIAIPSVNAAAKAEKLPEVTKDPINVYIFRGESCGFCHSALEFFEENNDKYDDYFNLIGFEVSDQNNQSLWQKVGDHFGDEIGSIPYIVIGDAYHETGFNEEVGEKLIATILEQYQNKDYVDVVANVINENNLAEKIEYSQNQEFAVLTNGQIVEDEKDNSNDVFIIIGIFVVLIGGITGLVIASKK